MTNTLIFVLCLVTIGVNSAVHGIQITLEEDLELERQLKIINKPPIKVIHTEYGYIVDCIDIKKQPAFDHPLLKNHTLQTKPSFHVPIEKTHVRPIFGLEDDECPTGTVPIRRTTKADLIREKALSYSIMAEGIPGVHMEVRGQTAIGYFPAALFSNMGSADRVGWGGRTLTPQGFRSPPMGSGHFPDMSFNHASFFREISYQDASRTSHGPESNQLEYIVDAPICFRLSYYGHLPGNVAYSLEFGGPGGICGN
ncbi:unnamed protein product [Sphenostylis stenocarpa]|uniref:Neprosin PEP catalytic domain-containing protein n=1 Tax=Sphenostylis stenocarpa TaxID=92480 RepID=A0AA86TC28_9FABA|nr:unnamed protein product [Sphenostylis stenocarpa]